jgi:hypothetical protein
VTYGHPLPFYLRQFVPIWAPWCTRFVHVLVSEPCNGHELR